MCSIDFINWVSFLYPTYLPAIFVLSAKPNKMAEDRTIPSDPKSKFFFLFSKTRSEVFLFRLPNSSICPMLCALCTCNPQPVPRNS